MDTPSSADHRRCLPGNLDVVPAAGENLGRWPLSAAVRVDHLEQVAAARAFTRDTLTAWHVAALTDPAVLVVSELVTNALVHASSTPVLTLLLRHATLRVSVTDTAAGLPQPRKASSEALGGRGMLLVDLVAERWGVEPQPDGKLVWAELTTTAVT